MSETKAGPTLELPHTLLSEADALRLLDAARSRARRRP